MQHIKISYLILWQRKISNSSDFKQLGIQFFIRNYVGTYQWSTPHPNLRCTMHNHRTGGLTVAQ